MQKVSPYEALRIKKARLKRKQANKRVMVQLASPPPELVFQNQPQKGLNFKGQQQEFGINANLLASDKALYGIHKLYGPKGNKMRDPMSIKTLDSFREGLEHDLVRDAPWLVGTEAQYEKHRKHIQTINREKTKQRHQSKREKKLQERMAKNPAYVYKPPTQKQLENLAAGREKRRLKLAGQV